MIRHLRYLLPLILIACSDETEIAVTGTGGAFEPGLAVSPAGVAVAWHDNRDGVDQIYLRHYTPDLHPTGPEHQLSNGSDPSYEADVVAFGADTVVAWYEVARDRRARVHVGAWNEAGEQRWRRTFAAASGRARIPVLVAANERVFIAWVEDADLAPTTPTRPSRLRYVWLDANGVPDGEPVTLAAASATTWNLNATLLDADRVAVVYDAGHETMAKELYLSLATDDAPTWRLSRDDGIASVYPDLAARDDILALTWFDETGDGSDVKLRFFPRSMLEGPAPLDLDRDAYAVTVTPGESIGAYVAWSGDRLGLAWNDNSVGQHELYFREFDADGNPLAATRRLTRTRRASLIPAIEAMEGAFLLSWSEVALDGHDTRQATVMLRRVRGD